MKKWRLLCLGIHIFATSLYAETQWWLNLNDTDITQLVATVRSQNLDIKESSARIQQAQALSNASQATQWPLISFIANTSYGNLMTPNNTNITQIGIQSQWSPDMFNQQGLEIKAAKARIISAEFTKENTEKKFICDTITTVLTRKQAQKSLSIIQKLIDTLNDYKILTAQQKDSGMISLLTFREIENQVFEAEQQKLQFNSILSAANASLKILLGVTGNQEILTNNTLNLPNHDLTLDTEELQKNPDIQRAFSDLKASDADLAQAESLVWPTLTLNGLYALQEASGPTIQRDDSIQNISANLNIPFLTFGRTQNKIDIAKAQKNVAWLRYQATLSKILQNKIALANEYKNKVEIYKLQERISQNITQTFALTTKQFEAGLIPKQTTYISEANSYKINLLMIQAQTDTAKSYVSYHRL